MPYYNNLKCEENISKIKKYVIYFPKIQLIVLNEGYTIERFQNVYPHRS